MKRALQYAAVLLFLVAVLAFIVWTATGPEIDLPTNYLTQGMN